MSSNFPNLNVLNKVFTNNSRISPNATSNNTVVEHKNFSMAHPQKVSATDLVSLLNQLDFNNLSQETNGSLKGDTKNGGHFHLTAGVLKFTNGHDCETDPAVPPANDMGSEYTPPAADTASGETVAADTGNPPPAPGNVFVY